eukprot:g3205.t1
MTTKQKLVVIGNGMAPGRVLETIFEMDPDKYDVTIFNAEPRVNYNRIMLSPVLSGEQTYDEIIIHGDDWYAEHGVTLHKGHKVTEIDRTSKTVTSEPGETASYDKLLIATGSNPFIIPIPGHDLPGVLAYRDLDDVNKMLDAATAGGRAVVIGGGLLGLEAAAGLLAQGMDVTVLHLMPTLMERQLDPAAGYLLEKELSGRGIDIRTEANTKAILGDKKVEGVELDDGTEIACDIVVMAVGIRPNAGLASAAGLDVGRGIKVDAAMRTSDPDVFSVGECIEFDGHCYGLVAPLYEQAQIAGAVLCGQDDQAFVHSETSTKLKVTGVDLFSAGDFADGDDREEIVFRDASRGVYKRLILEGDKLIGAVLYGDTADGAWFFSKIKSGEPIEAEARDTLIFGPSFAGGTPLDPMEAVAVLPDEAEICGCNGVSKGKILSAIDAEAAKAARGTKLIVIDPRETATTEAADLHLAIKPGGDVALFNWLFWKLAQSPAFDDAFMGQHTTGRIGKPGMGPFSITGQPNAMGGREVGGLANQLAAHMDHNGDDIARVKRFWNAPNMTSGQGLKALDMFDAVADGKIKAIWIMATNPAVSMPQADKVKAALEACPLVVISDVVVNADTVKLADVVLPATAWGEKSGTVTNSERRISRQRSFLKPPGEARHDWQALCAVAQKMGFPGFDYGDSSEIFREHAELSGFENNDTRDFDISAFKNITVETYDALEPFQWPMPADRTRPGTGAVDHRFFADGKFYTPDRKARFVATPYRAAQVQPDQDYPLILNTGRVRDHWHTMTRTGKAARLSVHMAEPYLEMHPDTASLLALADADLVRLVSRDGEAVLRLVVTERVQVGEVFAPMHWTGRFSSDGRIDALVGAAQDPLSGQQESKFTPVRAEALAPDWYGFGVFQDEPQPSVLSEFDYWCLARAEGGWRLECAGHSSPSIAVNLLLGDEIDSYLSLPGGGVRAAKFEDDTVAAAMIISRAKPVEADRTYLAQTLGQVLDSEERAGLLAGRPASGRSAGPLICSCEGVGQQTLIDAIANGADSVDALGACTRAGTNCGSCRPELQKLISTATLAASTPSRKERVA